MSVSSIFRNANHSPEYSQLSVHLLALGSSILNVDLGKSDKANEPDEQSKEKAQCYTIYYLKAEGAFQF